jgi:hypothetical protein
MEGAKTSGARRIIALLASLGILIIFVSGLVQGTVPQILSVVGGVLTVAAWGFALVTAIMNRQVDWVVTLILALVAGAAIAYLTLTDASPDAVSIPQTGGQAIGFLAAAYAALGSRPVVERNFPSFTGAWGLLTLVIGGTLVGGAIGTDIGASQPYITAVGFHLYLIAGVLALFAWIVALILSFRVGAWGWFAVVVLLTAVGAFMFGLFGPTRQDVLMAQEHARQRRAAGLN